MCCIAHSLQRPTHVNDTRVQAWRASCTSSSRPSSPSICSADTSGLLSINCQRKRANAIWHESHRPHETDRGTFKASRSSRKSTSKVSKVSCALSLDRQAAICEWPNKRHTHLAAYSAPPNCALPPCKAIEAGRSRIDAAEWADHRQALLRNAEEPSVAISLHAELAAALRLRLLNQIFALVENVSLVLPHLANRLNRECKEVETFPHTVGRPPLASLVAGIHCLRSNQVPVARPRLASSKEAF